MITYCKHLAASNKDMFASLTWMKWPMAVALRIAKAVPRWCLAGSQKDGFLMLSTFQLRKRWTAEQVPLNQRKHAGPSNAIERAKTLPGHFARFVNLRILLNATSIKYHKDIIKSCNILLPGLDKSRAKNRLEAQETGLLPKAKTDISWHQRTLHKN